MASAHTLCDLDNTQTLTNKTLTAPVVTNPSISGGGTWTGGPTLSNTPVVDAAPTTNLGIANKQYVDNSSAGSSAIRKGLMSVTSAGATGTYTADEIVVESSLGGPALKLASYSQACNLATTGAGGMDTGSAPVSGFVSLYAIAKADGTKNILACAVATSTATIYGGANMPTGYTYSNLLGIWPTNGSSQFVAGLLIDRKFFYQTFVNTASNVTAPSTLTSLSLSSAVPTVARWVTCVTGSSGVNFNIVFGMASDATGTGGQVFGSYTGATARATVGGMASLTGAWTFVLPIITSQTVYWREAGGNTNAYSYVSSYEV